ncbi:MAG: hypothetical protein AAF518_28070 [Spirochaetota bacterium]
MKKYPLSAENFPRLALPQRSNKIYMFGNDNDPPNEWKETYCMLQKDLRINRYERILFSTEFTEEEKEQLQQRYLTTHSILVSLLEETETISPNIYWRKDYLETL